MRRSGFALLAALAALPPAAPAAGLGRLAVMSRVGEPLVTEIEIVSIQGNEGDSLAARVAPPDVYRSAHIVPLPPVEALRATVERRADGRPVVKVTSTAPLEKPLVNLLLELSWAGGSPVVRQYSFLLDTQDRKPPPVASPPPAADTAAPKPDAPAPPPVAALAPSAATPRPTAVVPTPTPPGTAPAESAPAAAIPEGGGTYVVQPGDSLLKVAQSTRYEGLSFAQMVVAIHRANEDAFSGGDMSKLKGGRTLKIPGRDAVAAVNAEEARQQVAALRGQPDAGRAQPEPARSRPMAREPGPAGDDVVARERALAESRDRAAVLEQTRGDLQRLIQAREKEIADLERELAAKSGKSQPVRK